MDKRGKGPTDLGVLGLGETKAALEKIKGPTNFTPNIKKDDFSHLTAAERAQVSREARERLSDTFSPVRRSMFNFIKIFLAQRLLHTVAERVLGKAYAKPISWALLVLGIYHRWGAWKVSSKEKSTHPVVLPFVGALPSIAMNKDRMHDFLVEMVTKNNFRTVEIPVPMGSFVLLMDARDREYVLKTNLWNYMKNREDDDGSLENVFSEVLGRGIFATDKSEWLESRKIASHMFSGNALRTQMENVFNHHADRVVHLLRTTVANKGAVIDIQEVYQCAVFDAFCEIAFGVYPNATDAAIEGTKPEFLIAFDFAQLVASERIMTPPISWMLARALAVFTNSGKEGQFAEAMKTIDSYIYKIIDERLLESQETMAKRNDLLSLYIQFSRSQSVPFTKQEYRDIIANFMIAGRDTTSCTLCYATKLLSENPACLEQLDCQGLFKLGQTTERITWEESKTIPYADACVNEVLRLAPPVGDDIRICVGEDQLPSGLRVRLGTRVVIPNMAIGRDPFLWSNPEKFDPDRWMRYDETGNALSVRRVDEYVHPIFFAGRRLCLGKDMARFEAIVFMSKLFRALRIKPVPNQDPAIVSAPVIFLKHGLKCTVETRHASSDA